MLRPNPSESLDSVPQSGLDDSKNACFPECELVIAPAVEALAVRAGFEFSRHEAFSSFDCPPDSKGEYPALLHPPRQPIAPFGRRASVCLVRLNRPAACSPLAKTTLRLCGLEELLLVDQVLVSHHRDEEYNKLKDCYRHRLGNR